MITVTMLVMAPLMVGMTLMAPVAAAGISLAPAPYPAAVLSSTVRGVSLSLAAFDEH